MAKVYDVVATVGEYETKTGEKKKKYMNIGSVVETKNGLSLKLESVPLNWEGWAGLYQPKEREQVKQSDKQSSDDFKDDIPF